MENKGGKFSEGIICDVLVYISFIIVTITFLKILN